MDLSFLSLLSFLAVTNISCKSQFGPCETGDYQKIQNLKGKNIFVIHKKDVEERLLQDFRNENVYVQKILPKTLNILIEKRRNYASITKEGLEGTFLISQDGTVLSFEKESALPTIVLSGEFENPIVGQKLNPDVVNASRLVLFISKITKVKSSRLLEDSLIVNLESVEVTLPVNGDPEVLAGALQLILMQSKMDNKLPETIDLRYKNPVLKYGKI